MWFLFSNWLLTDKALRIKTLGWNFVISLVMWLALNPNVKLLTSGNYDANNM